MTLPHMTAHRSIGATRFTRWGLSGSSQTAYQAAGPVHSGDSWLFCLTTPTGERAAKLTLKPKPGGRMEIYDLYVNEAHRGQRLSRQLMAQAAQKARCLGGTHLWLEADAGSGEGLANPKLHAIYEKMGFHKTKRNSQGRQEMEASLSSSLQYR